MKTLKTLSRCLGGRSTYLRLQALAPLQVRMKIPHCDNDVNMLMMNYEDYEVADDDKVMIIDDHQGLSKVRM